MHDSTSGIVVIDFTSRFPHKFWISSWSRDEQYPSGFRYKLLSVRPEPNGQIELVIILEDSTGAKTEMSRLDVDQSALDTMSAVFLEGLAEEYGIDFELLDFSRIRTSDEFERQAAAAGWYSTCIQ
jgi:hypothetical protein